jgi:hypothetical protein
LQSACKVLENYNGAKINIIPIPEEEGIVALAFGFKEVFDEFGLDFEEVAMDSTCE